MDAIFDRTMSKHIRVVTNRRAIWLTVMAAASGRRVVLVTSGRARNQYHIPVSIATASWIFPSMGYPVWSGGRNMVGTKCLAGDCDMVSVSPVPFVKQVSDQRPREIREV